MVSVTALKLWENSGKLRTLYRMKWDSCDLILGCLCRFLNLHCSTLTSLNLPKDKNMINMNLGFLGSPHQTLHPGCNTQRFGTLKCIEYLPQCVPKRPLTSVWMWGGERRIWMRLMAGPWAPQGRSAKKSELGTPVLLPAPPLQQVQPQSLPLSGGTCPTSAAAPSSTDSHSCSLHPAGPGMFAVLEIVRMR